MDTERDEPITPVSRLFLQPEMNHIIHCVVAGKHPIDADVVRSLIRNSPILKHPSICSLMVKDRHGREHWRKTQVDVDRHVIVHPEPVGEINDAGAVNDFLADLAISSSLSVEKPLWEIHLLLAHRCAVFRVHHALGDGVSLMSLFLSSFCRRADDPDQPPSMNSFSDSSSSSSSSSSTNRGEEVVWRVVKAMWFTVLFVLEFVLRSFWLRDKRTAVSGGDGMELWPRKLATARFVIDDMMTVKKAVVDAVSFKLSI